MDFVKIGEAAQTATRKGPAGEQRSRDREADAVAPIMIVIPLLQLSLVFRLFFSAWVNPDHEIFGLKVIVGTVISMVGACAVAVDTDFILAALRVPYTLTQVLRLSVS